MSQISKIIASILVILALLLTAFALYLMAKPDAEPIPVVMPETTPPPLHNVVVAKEPLKAGAMLSSDKIKIEQWPIQPEHSFSDPSLLEGRHLRTDLAPGELIQDSMLMKGLAYYLEPGERAITVPIQADNAQASRIEAGDYVDIFFLLKRQSATGEVDTSQSRLLLAKKRVLALGAQSLDEPITENNQSHSALSNTAVLAIPLEEVNPLLIAAREGVLQLVVRSPLDEDLPDTSLFPERTHVLTTKEDLTTEQQQAMQKPENKAFAGMSLSEIAAAENKKEQDSKTTPKAAPTRTAQIPTARAIEIIRGPNSQLEHY